MCKKMANYFPIPSKHTPHDLEKSDLMWVVGEGESCMMQRSFFNNLIKVGWSEREIFWRQNGGMPKMITRLDHLRMFPSRLTDIQWLQLARQLISEGL